MDIRVTLRRLGFGLATLSGLAPRGFVIPYRYAAGIAPAATNPGLAARFQAAAPTFRRVLAAIERVAPALLAFTEGAPAPAPRFTQDWFPALDAAAAYAIVRDRRPARIVEVGSGHSTRFLAAALQAAGGGRLTAIDPAPRATLAGLAGVEVLRRPVQEVAAEVFAALQPGDVLCIDSSHVLMPGTDVDLLLATVLPALPAGVLVHLHDIFLPDGYPADWAWRGYNEACGVAALLAGGGFELLFASHYVQTRLAADVAASVVARLPRVAGARDSSLWLVKGSSAPAPAAR
ncbi:MAG: class I SAM-dependent methyltransferase [Alphaproteobacteria bacterium]|nr:class I SAM-dependent methyltransferase [Alphaproteobacteria bacterium]